tara:strand:+ start:407 stop:1051 length:645 start_codon:yes stop_codon:yes gene_type:complete
MEEDITIINTKTRNEKIKNFFIENRKIFVLLIIFIITILIGFFSYKYIKDKKRETLSNQYNKVVIDFKSGNKSGVVFSLKEIINTNDSTYSPLALYFLIDNNLIEDLDEVNQLFDVIIEKSSLEKEIKNLITYKKALYNSDKINENQLLEILNPLINSNSIWKSHALYLIGEFFYSKKELQKAKEFFNQIISVENANPDIVLKSQKRLNRDLSD